MHAYLAHVYGVLCRATSDPRTWGERDADKSLPCLKDTVADKWRADLKHDEDPAHGESLIVVEESD